MGADHAFHNERARVLLPFRSTVRAHLVETAASLTSRVAHRVRGFQALSTPRIIASDEERVAMFSRAAEYIDLRRSSQALVALEAEKGAEPARRHARRRSGRAKVRRFREGAA